MKRCLIVVAKQPIAGQVKTRIGATLGAEEAAALYRCSLEDTLELVGSYNAEPVISYAPDDDAAQGFFSNLAPNFTLVPQQGAGFGERLLSAFQQLAERGFDQMVLISTDSPSLPCSYLDQAFDALQDPQVDAVLGPVTDGGYYLIGMRTPLAILFERITWSTEVVAAETHQRAVEAGLKLVDVSTWYDLDTADDLQVLYDDVSRAADNRAPHTHAWIERVGLAVQPNSKQ